MLCSFLTSANACSYLFGKNLAWSEKNCPFSGLYKQKISQGELNAMNFFPIKSFSSVTSKTSFKWFNCSSYPLGVLHAG